jgi:hypothetical protein
MRTARPKYAVRAYWRAVGGSGHEILYRRTLAELDRLNCRGDPMQLWSVMRNGVTMADCYTRKDAARIVEMLRVLRE